MLPRWLHKMEYCVCLHDTRSLPLIYCYIPVWSLPVTVIIWYNGVQVSQLFAALYYRLLICLSILGIIFLD
jgi:hypothetical protein